MMAKKRLWITNLRLVTQVVYIKDVDPGLPANCDENKDCKLIIPPAETRSVLVDEADIPRLRKRVAGIEGLRIDDRY